MPYGLVMVTQLWKQGDIRFWVVLTDAAQAGVGFSLMHYLICLIQFNPMC